MLGFGVLYMVNDYEHRCSMTSTCMNPIWISDQSMLGDFYCVFEYVIASYDGMWVYVVYSP